MGRGPYLKVGLLVAVAAAILGAGYFGPHAGSGGATPSPSTQAAGNTAQSETPAASASIPAGIAGLTRIDPAPDQIDVAWLPGQITSSSMALLGRRIFYIVDGDRIQSTDIGGNAREQAIVTVPECLGINQVLAAGHMLAYVVTAPGGSTAQVHDCGDAARVSWTIWLLDLDGGAPTEVAHGIRAVTAIDVAEFPVHLALTETALAFDRPPEAGTAGVGETVEVQALDGRSLWTTRTASPVQDVMLGGGTLAILTDAPSPTGDVFDLWTSTAGHPALSSAPRPALSASLSPDGRFLAWDVAPQDQLPGAETATGVAIETVALGADASLDTPTDPVQAAPARPAAWSVDGREFLTWFATAPSGAIYPAVRYVGGGSGAFLPSPQEPIWIQVQGSTLVWVAESADGWTKAAFAVDLDSLGLK